VATAADQSGDDPAFVLVGGRPSLDLVATSGGDTRQRGGGFNRVGTVEDVAALVRYLASPAAQWTTGRVLDVTGGSAI
jgi:NAD(P)-dependent dehydrogenase (short-subunit alcohol dehydrogenase family)